VRPRMGPCRECVERVLVLETPFPECRRLRVAAKWMRPLPTRRRMAGRWRALRSHIVQTEKRSVKRNGRPGEAFAHSRCGSCVQESGLFTIRRSIDSQKRGDTW
jgi:hypothetical protein